MLPMISSLGFPGSTFGDCDFAIIGIILGLILGHIILFFSATKYHLADQYGIQGHYFCIDEIYVLFIGLVCGLIATILPVIRASNQNIHHTISKI